MNCDIQVIFKQCVENFSLNYSCGSGLWGRRGRIPQASTASYFTQLFGTNSHFPKAKADKKGAHCRLLLYCLCLSKERRLYPWICQHECSTTTVGAEKKPRPTKTNIFSSTADNDKPNRLFPKMWRHTHLMNDRRLSPVAKNDREKGDKECYTWVVSKKRKKEHKEYLISFPNECPLFGHEWRLFRFMWGSLVNSTSPKLPVRWHLCLSLSSFCIWKCVTISLISCYSPEQIFKRQTIFPPRKLVT